MRNRHHTYERAEIHSLRAAHLLCSPLSNSSDPVGHTQSRTIEQLLQCTVALCEVAQAAAAPYIYNVKFIRITSC